jgi:hypothetical protein
VFRAKTPADLEQARQAVGWLDDDDLRETERKSRAGAGLLGFFTWGGGRLYLGDIPRGVGGIALLVAWSVVAGVLPAAVGSLGFVLAGLAGAAWSYRDAKCINRFVAIRDELQLRAGPPPSAYRLLAAAAAVDPGLAHAVPPSVLQAPATASGPHAPLLERLRKLAALRTAGVITEPELQERKLELLEQAAPASTAELDELMFALLPLRDEGVLLPEDFELLKQLGGGR